jgi:hypothetical protein
MSRVCDVNTTGRACRNELDSDGLCQKVAFVPDDVRMVTPVIDKRHALGVRVRLAFGIV